MTDITIQTANTNVAVVGNTDVAVVSANTDVAVVTVDANSTAVIPYAQNTAAHIQDDYSVARNNLYQLMNIGLKSVEELANIATASQHVRAYEAMSALIKSVSDTNDKFLVLQNNRQALEDHEAKPDNEPASGGGKMVINSGNTVFVGTAAELQDMIRNKTV